MRYRVFWTPIAEQRLESLLRKATDAHRLASIVKTIDRQLVKNPKGLGESRFDTVRVAFMLPIGVQFEILEDVRTVVVFDVWTVKRK